MTPVVAKIIDNLIGREGRYVNHKSDRGGETIWGVTIETARANGYAGPMRDMPRAVAVDIYEKKYWHQPGFGRVAALSLSIAEECFDTGVNMGPAVAVRFLHEALNALNRQQADYPDVGGDSTVTPLTLDALGAYLSYRGDDGVKVMLLALNCLQGERYIRIAEDRPKNEDFVHGWLLHRVTL